MIAIAFVAWLTGFAILGAYFIAHGNWRLGVAQILLLAANAVLFSGGFK